MNIDQNSIVADVVRSNYKTAQLFESNNIDFCCGGNITIEEASRRSGTNVSDLLTGINSLMGQEDKDSKFIENLPLDQLCNYIVERHHSYVNEKTPFIQQKLEKLCSVHGANHPELFEVKSLFDSAAMNLSSHMKKEEEILFPYIKEIVRAERGKIADIKNMGNTLDTINDMREEHQIEGDRFRKIMEITDRYTTPADGCNTYEITYRMLEEFENDLHRHIHLENNILFPKAIELEKQLQTA